MTGEGSLTGRRHAAAEGDCMQDEEIIELYFRREEQAITQTDIKYGRYCRTIAWNILFSREDSEECVNDAYLDTWQSVPPTRPVSLKAYVGRITRNHAINRYEKNTAGKRGGGETPLCLEELAECVSGDGGPEQVMDYRHLTACLNQFLKGLKREQRNVFLRRYWYGSSIKEIAGSFGMTESSVKVTLMRLRNRLREELAGEGVLI